MLEPLPPSHLSQLTREPCARSVHSRVASQRLSATRQESLGLQGLSTLACRQRTWFPHAASLRASYRDAWRSIRLPVCCCPTRSFSRNRGLLAFDLVHVSEKIGCRWLLPCSRFL